MPMEVLYSQPYLQTELATPSDFPQAIDVLIAGHQYVVNTSFEPYRRDAFRHRSIQPQRESIDLTNIPGEGTVNTEGLWRRAAEDWHFGAGQPYQDRKGSVDARFEESKGIDPWMQWQCQLLNDTVQVFPLTGTAQIINAGGTVWIADFAANTITFGTTASGYSPMTTQTWPFGTLTKMATDGNTVWFATNGASDGIYSTPFDGSTAIPISGITQYVTSGNFDGVWWVGERLMATTGPIVYNIIASGSPPTALWTHPSPTWRWTDMCAGSSQIYLSGNIPGPTSAAASTVFRSTIEPTGTALTIPVQALPMEAGEYVVSLYGYLNYVFLGTNLGVRMCRTLAAYDPTGNQGDLEAGPLLPGLFPPGPVSQPVQCLIGNNRFMYFGWSNYDSQSTGLGRMDLSTFIDTQAPAFTSDLMVTNPPGGTQGLVTSMAWDATANAPVFVVAGSGVWTDAGFPVTSGYIDSGQIGYGISDDKILWAGDIGTVSPQAGQISMSIAADASTDNTLTLVGSQPAGGTPNQSPFAISQIRGELFKVRMTLTKDPNTGASPIMHRWTLKALPAITAGTTISAVLLLYATVSNRGGDSYLNAYAEYQYLYNLRTTQTVVEYQEGPFSAMCVIDELDWLPFKEHDADPQGGFIGDLIVYLKTVDIGA
jgi:hypothetical protein